MTPLTQASFGTNESIELYHGLRAAGGFLARSLTGEESAQTIEPSPCLCELLTNISHAQQVTPLEFGNMFGASGQHTGRQAQTSGSPLPAKWDDLSFRNNYLGDAKKPKPERGRDNCSRVRDPPCCAQCQPHSPVALI